MTGSGIYINQIIKQARRHDFRNALLAGIPSGDEGAVVDDLEHFFPVYFGENGDIPFPVTGMSDVMPYLSSRFRDLDASSLARYEASMEEKLRFAVATFKPDIIHANHLWLLTSLAKKLFPDIPVVASCHGSDIRQYLANIHLREKVLEGCRKLEAVFALSPAQAKEISELYTICPSKVYVTGAGYDQTLFKINKKKEGKQRTVLYAGKLANAKGVPWLLDAFKNVVGDDVILHLCGSGTGVEAENIKSKAALDPRVIIHGNVNQHTLARLMQEADVFVLPSFYEGVPLVLLEAMACGCRLVATRLPGVEYVFGEAGEDVSIIDLPELEGIDQPALNAENKFVKQLANALQQQLFRHPYGRHADDAESAKSILSHFTWESVFQRVMATYQTVRYTRLSPQRQYHHAA